MLRGTRSRRKSKPVAYWELDHCRNDERLAVDTRVAPAASRTRIVGLPGTGYFQASTFDDGMLLRDGHWMRHLEPLVVMDERRAQAPAVSGDSSAQLPGARVVREW